MTTKREVSTLVAALMSCTHVDARALNHRYCGDCGAALALPFAAQRWVCPRLVEEAIERDRTPRGHGAAGGTGGISR
jgi:predicted RNA-binding Zn-ribbon protein involved in translation (DUF1610 family)